MLGPYPTVYRIPLDSRRHADDEGCGALESTEPLGWYFVL
jgi:hypothetical protein